MVRLKPGRALNRFLVICRNCPRVTRPKYSAQSQSSNGIRSKWSATRRQKPRPAGAAALSAVFRGLSRKEAAQGLAPLSIPLLDCDCAEYLGRVTLGQFRQMTKKRFSALPGFN